MNPEDVQDAVLTVLGAAEKALTDEQILAQVEQGPTLRDVRIALRDLHNTGDANKDESGHWRMAVPPPPIKVGGGRGEFSVDEIRRARERYGNASHCPKCGKTGDTESLFGWRRLHPKDQDICPQSYCRVCRPTVRRS